MGKKEVAEKKKVQRRKWERKSMNGGKKGKNKETKP